MIQAPVYLSVTSSRYDMAIIMSLQDTISSAEKDVVRVVLRCNDATENQKLGKLDILIIII